MKNKNLALSLLVALSIGLVASCNNESVSELKNSAGERVYLKIEDKEITNEQLFNNLILSKAGVEAIYNAVDKVVIQASHAVGDEEKEAIKKLVDDFEAKTRSDAGQYGISYTSMRDINLANLGLKTMDDLKEYYTVQVLRPKLKEIYFPTTYPKVSGERNSLIEEYVNTAQPTHLKHILSNVADSTLYRGTISESEARRLTTITNRLIKGESFAAVAFEESQDEGSRVKSGDLGVMDTYTGFVPEFKYGVYAYLAYGLHKDKAQVVKEKLAVPSTLDAIYGNGFRSIKVSKVKELIANFEKDKNEDVINKQYAATKLNKDIADITDAEVTALYPRNTLFNEMFNFPSVAFIEYDGEVPVGAKVAEINYLVGGGTKKVVADERNNPIVIARSQYGIHFISVTRSSFEERAVDYYKLVDVSGDFKPYIKLGTTTKDAEERYNYITSLVKNYIGGAAIGMTADETLMDYRMFNYYVAAKNVQFNNVKFSYGYNNAEATLETLVNDYVNYKLNSKKLKVENTINSNWLSYVRILQREAEVKNK